MTIRNGSPWFNVAGRAPTHEVTFARAAALLLREGLTHVGREVFEEGPVHDALCDASTAVEAALLGTGGAPVTVSFTDDEVRAMPKAIGHLADEVFDDAPDRRRLLRAARDAVRELAGPASPGP